MAAEPTGSIQLFSQVVHSRTIKPIETNGPSAAFMQHIKTAGTSLPSYVLRMKEQREAGQVDVLV